MENLPIFDTSSLEGSIPSTRTVNFTSENQKIKSECSKSAVNFTQFHTSHPDIYTLFKRLTFDKIAIGFTHYSADAVLHAVRWHYDTSTAGLAPKINNNYTAFYARKFHKDFPQYDGFFKTRKSEADL